MALAPQQLPGPAQPASWGDTPQQAVSPGPDIDIFPTPDKEDGAESCFFMLVLPQFLHSGSTDVPVTKISALDPQDSH